MNFHPVTAHAATTSFTSSVVISLVGRDPATRLMRIIALGALALLSPLALGAEATLTLREAQRQAVERSALPPAQSSSASASRQLASAAGRLPDPVLTFGIDNLPVNGPDAFSPSSDFMTMRRIGVMQEFTRSEKRELRALVLERQAERMMTERAATIAAIHRDTALAWLDRYYAEALVSIVTQQIAEARAEMTAAESAYRAGRGSQADVFAAHGATAALEDQSSELGRRVRTAKANLARWIGGASAEAPLGNKPSIDSIHLTTDQLESQLAHHPQLALLSRREEIASAEARLAQANKKSDWSVELSYSQRGSAYSNMVSLGVSIPLQWDQKNRQDREVAARLAEFNQARADREDALRAHTAEVRVMVLEWENGRERLGRYQRELLPLASERTRATLASYHGGRSSIVDVLSARRNETDTRMRAVQLEAEVARLWAQLEFLIPASDTDGALHAPSEGTAESGVSR